jgi:transcriptional regulator with GAF, ATPase, and Fis domain
MLVKFRRFPEKTRLVVLVIFILFCLFAASPMPWNAPVENALIDLQFKLRGERKLADDLVLVFIGAEDIGALGGWPITRDYYGYMMHALMSRGAKVIGFDLLFDTSNSRYPEHDDILAGFFESAGNVCLPMAFSGGISYESAKEKTTHEVLAIATGHHPVFPIDQFKEHAAGLGFSNFGEEAAPRKVPLVVEHGDSLFFSLGFELARLYLGASRSMEIIQEAIIAKDKRISFPVDQQGRIRLNHFGGVDEISAIGFVDLLQAFERAPDSLDFAGKLVLVAVIAPGYATLKTTPFVGALPASLLHLTVAENLIQGNFLREAPMPFHWILIALLTIAARLTWRANRILVNMAIGAGVIFIYCSTAMAAFRYWNLVLPLFYPTLAYATHLAFHGIRRVHKQREIDASIKALLQEQIVVKEAQLEAAKNKLAEMQNQFQSNATLSKQTQQLVEEREQTIFVLEKQLRDLQTYIVPEKPISPMQFPEIIHDASSKMANALELVAKVASDDIPVLLLGETGTGKEMIARAIHHAGMRRNAAFVAINCGALPETLLESELFGHEKGSFTGAHTRRRGRFELANGGTIFLDEITETTPAFQARLLRVLQEKNFERVGGEQTLQVDVRVIAASSRDLQQEVEQGRFRSDLFYRLNGFPITLPPLRERPEDLPLLAAHFLKKHGYRSISGFSDRAMENLRAYHWPGNVRELENVVRRTAILAQSEGRSIIQANDLPKEIMERHASSAPLAAAYKPLEEQILDMLRALKFSHSAISQTAKALGNRDRGTITEYFRGLCFEHLVICGYNVEAAAKSIAATEDKVIVERVQAKINGYLQNLQDALVSLDGDEDHEAKSRSHYKGLPKKYHPYLQQIIAHKVRS